MPRYNNKKNILISPLEFRAMLEKVHSEWFLHELRSRALLVVLYYTGCRISEALALKKEDVHRDKETLYIHITRLKHSHETPDLPIDLETPLGENPGCLLDLIVWMGHIKKDKPVFPFTRRTALSICNALGLYPHYFRLNRISQIIRDYGVLQAQNWTGLSLSTLDHYSGLIDLKNVGKGI